MNLPQELRYANSHEWVRIDADDTLTIGISDHAQEALGDVVFLELPPVGKHVTVGDSIAVIESVKAASDIYAPISGEIIAINDDIVNAPELINQDSYASWLFKIKPSDTSQIDALLDANAYGKLIGV